MQFQFDSLADFLAMSGHGPYVWGSYCVTLLVMAALAVVPLLRQRTLRQALGRQLRQEEARRRALTARQAHPQPEIAD
ncbi:heme exporter protein CcmD [Microbulbifer bruguierae]|uniref:Heme exporter protein D n=1 Tax=Microbulbifer bruguierae TaxID=3029061 RepID=A0ABY8NH84_9GAMM|nr:heme exporter protein CcmD [Microbulbifer bruguierae]WGL17422.1 heme exporter protein CcmD [Microbulbifer bruguierae]